MKSNKINSIEDYVNSTKKEEDNLYDWVEPFSMLPMSGLGLAISAGIAIVVAPNKPQYQEIPVNNHPNPHHLKQPAKNA